MYWVVLAHKHKCQVYHLPVAWLSPMSSGYSYFPFFLLPIRQINIRESVTLNNKLLMCLDFKTNVPHSYKQSRNWVTLFFFWLYFSFHHVDSVLLIFPLPWVEFRKNVTFLEVVFSSYDVGEFELFAFLLEFELGSTEVSILIPSPMTSWSHGHWICKTLMSFMSSHQIRFGSDWWLDIDQCKLGPVMHLWNKTHHDTAGIWLVAQRYLNSSGSCGFAWLKQLPKPRDRRIVKFSWVMECSQIYCYCQRKSSIVIGDVSWSSV